jgi:hypothetical protein
MHAMVNDEMFNLSLEDEQSDFEKAKPSKDHIHPDENLSSTLTDLNVHDLMKVIISNNNLIESLEKELQQKNRHMGKLLAV